MLSCGKLFCELSKKEKTEVLKNTPPKILHNIIKNNIPIITEKEMKEKNIEILPDNFISIFCTEKLNSNKGMFQLYDTKNNIVIYKDFLKEYRVKPKIKKDNNLKRFYLEFTVNNKNFFADEILLNDFLENRK